MSILLLGLCGLLAPASASAALPYKKAAFEAHDHAVAGKNWHVQLEISAVNQRAAEALVLYAEVCGATVFKSAVPISAEGVIAAAGPVKGGGTWRVDGTFTAPNLFEGVASLTKGDCDTGPLPFKATTGADGHSGHEHSAPGDGAHVHGPLYADFTGATVKEIRQAVAMRRRSFVAAAELFPTYAAALARGFTSALPRSQQKRPQMFHLRHNGYELDDITFNTTKPESLVYYRPLVGDPILVGLMFRVPAGPRPAFAGPIPIYHQHSRAAGLAAPGSNDLSQSPMTHVWLSNKLDTAWANCLPVKDLEATLPSFRYVPPAQSGAQVTLPCPTA